MQCAHHRMVRMVRGPQRPPHSRPTGLVAELDYLKSRLVTHCNSGTERGSPVAFHVFQRELSFIKLNG